MKWVTTLLAFVCCASCIGQAILKPSIGVGALPQDDASVCLIPLYLDEFDASGYHVGDTVNDFTIYNLNGDSLNLATALANGKPKLLIAASYTCPVFRNKLQSINDVVNLYGDLVDVYIVYTLEAHPVDEISPYFGYVNVTTANQEDNVLYPQPETYGERKDIVSDMLSGLNVLPPVLIDGPCNNWWQHYGPAPNNATLIDANGLVYAKHDWYDRFGNDITCDITTMLGLPANCDTAANTNGDFAFNFISNDTVTGIAGTVVSVESELVNNSNNDVLVTLKRMNDSLPTGWETAFCMDVCYPAQTDSVTVLIPAGQSQPLHYYFFTNETPGFGRVKIGMRNESDFSNSGIAFFSARTLADVTATAVQPPTGFLITTNPVRDVAFVYARGSSPCRLALSDPSGRILMNALVDNAEEIYRLDVRDYSSGLYWLTMESAEHGRQTLKFIIVR